MADETDDFIIVNKGRGGNARDAGDESNWHLYEEMFESEVRPQVSMPYIQYEDQSVSSLPDEQQNFELENFVEEENTEVPDFSKHNLILKESINDQGFKIETYYCQECNLEYNDINDFLNQHPGVELLTETPEEEEDVTGEVEQVNVEAAEPMPMQINNTQDKLWDLVEDLRESGDLEDHQTNEEFVEKVEPIEQIEAVEKTETFEAENDRYYCYECHQVFTDLETAEQHDCTQDQVDQGEIQKTENTEELEDFVMDESQKVVDFACAYCSQVFSSYDDLLNHIANCQQNVPVKTIATTEGPVYRCEMCNKNYPNLRSYNNHRRLHKKAKDGKLPSMSGPIVCEICNTNFASSKNLRLHMKMHDERQLKSIQDALPAGAQTEYNELHQFYCEICNKSFDQRLLAVHKNMHQNVEEYNCSICNKQFENLLSYDMHIQMHAENRMQSGKKIDLNENAQKTTGINPAKKHQCQYCGKEFQRPYEKVKHERIHTGEKPYNCEVCGKSFRVSYSLTLHLRTHTDIRPYVCATCNKRFKQQSVYVHHLKTHVAERQYKCDICGKSFRTSVQLCGHKNSHKKPFNCTECNRPFASLYYVKIHMKTHNKSHKSNKNLKNRCKICGASYARIYALRLHLKEQHGLDVDPGQLLSSEYSSGNFVSSKDFDNDSQIQQQLQEFITDSDDDDDDDDNDRNSNLNHNQGDQNKGSFNKAKGYLGNKLITSAELDETAAATQTILKANEEIITDDFHSEEIITDW